MRLHKSESIVNELFAQADIEVNGTQPYDLQVNDKRFYRRFLADGALGFGESYVEGWWDCEQLAELMSKSFGAELDVIITGNWRTVLYLMLLRLTNLQRVSRAYQVGEVHYDIGNDLYRAMLDRRMVYSCGYWRDAANLDQAQEAKLDLICRKLHLAPGLTVLDLGCGWGALAKYAAENYGVSVVGTTVSRNQYELGRELCKGLPVELRLGDYRSIVGTFDRVVSVGFFEHVGWKNYGRYMELTAQWLKPNGIALLQTIGRNRSATVPNYWVHKYLFPNSMIPSIAQIGEALEGLLVMEDWHNFGPDYERTLAAWHERFEAAWNDLCANYGERFRRLWRFYLLGALGNFRARSLQLWQLVLTHPGREQPASRLK